MATVGQSAIVEETILDEERIRATMRYLASQQPSVRLRAGGRIMRGRLNETGAILDGWNESVPNQPPFDLEIDGMHAFYVAHWPTGSPADGPPDRLVRFRSRRERRVAAPARLYASVDLGGQKQECRLINLSLRGLAFDIDPGAPLPAKGQALEEIGIHWKGGTPLEVSGKIAGITQLPDGRARCGVALEDGLGSTRWRGAVSGLLYPRTTVASVPADALWELYERSGYFGLSGKTPEDFRHLRSAFAETQRRLACAPEVGAVICWSSSSRLEGAVLHLEVWEGSWLSFQLARRHDDRPLGAADDAGLHDLYRHCYEYVHQAGQPRWIVSYIQDSARFTKRVNLELAERHAATGNACVVPFRAIELDTDGNGVSPLVREANAIDRAAIRAKLLSRRPAAYLAATGLDQPDLELGAVVDRWADAGFARSRRVIVAENAGASAAAILESADEGLHLFGLLDMVRVVPLRPGAHRVFPVLLEAARAYYRRLGKSRFVYFLEDEGEEHVPALGGRDLGAASYVVLSASLVPELLEHLEIVTHPAA
jgi:hypothetical protein